MLLNSEDLIFQFLNNFSLSIINSSSIWKKVIQQEKYAERDGLNKFDLRFFILLFSVIYVPSINNFYRIYYVWQKVIRVNINLLFLKNTRVIQTILFAEAHGREDFVGGVT